MWIIAPKFPTPILRSGFGTSRRARSNRIDVQVVEVGAFSRPFAVDNVPVLFRSSSYRKSRRTSLSHQGSDGFLPDRVLENEQDRVFGSSPSAKPFDRR